MGTISELEEGGKLRDDVAVLTKSFDSDGFMFKVALSHCCLSTQIPSARLLGHVSPLFVAFC